MSFYQFDGEEGVNNNFINDDFLRKICVNIYRAHINNKKIDISEYLIKISKFSVEHSREKNLRLLSTLFNTIPSVIKEMKDEVNSIKELKLALNQKKSNNDINEKIKNIIEDLTRISNGIVDASNDFSKIFKTPIMILMYGTKDTVSFIKIHKEVFFSLLCEDEFIKKTISKIRQKGSEFQWVNEIFKEIENGIDESKTELTHIREMISKEKNEINDIDDLLKYINENDSKKQKKSKKNKKKSSNRTSSSSKEEEINQVIENEIIQIKNSIKEHSIPANDVCKIQPKFSEQWIIAIKSKQ